MVDRKSPSISTAYMKHLSLHFALLILGCLTALGGTPIVEKTFNEKYPDIQAPRWKAKSNGTW
ncbi:MAG: hypothetical protein QNK80_00965, partial [Akkermansiaceae bacterium]